MKPRYHFLYKLLPIVLLGGISAVQAQVLQDKKTQRTETWYTVSDDQLDQMRGGFSLDNGLTVSLGVTLVAYVNERLVTQTVIPRIQLDQFNADVAAEVQKQMNALTLIQNGTGNTYGSQQNTSDAAPLVERIDGTGPGIIVQNALNNQNIYTQTIFDVDTNALGMMRSQEWINTLRDSLSNIGNIR